MFSDEDLVEAIYAGAEHPRALNAALEAAATRINASGANIHVVRKSDLKSVLFLTYGPNYSGRAVRAYFDHWRHINPYRVAMRRVDGVFLCHEHLSAHELSRSAYAQDFFFPLGERWLAGGVCQNDGLYEVSLVFNRARGDGSFSELARREIGMLLPHFRRAASLATRAASLVHEQGALNAAIAMASQPAWLVDQQARVLWCNEAGEAELRAARLLFETERRLTVRDARAHALLIKALHCVGARDPDFGAEPPIRMADDGAVLTLEVIPASIPDGALLGAKASALVLGRRISMTPRAEAELMRSFTFTKTEACLALEVASGQSNEEIAQRRNVSPETVRTQLRSIYNKSGVSSRAQLVTLVWRHVA